MTMVGGNQEGLGGERVTMEGGFNASKGRASFP